MNNTALLVVDVQTGLIKKHPYNEQKVISNIKGLISSARTSGTEIIYIRHQDPIGEELEYGTDNWQIYAEVAPLQNEKVFEKKYSSAFVKTNLKQYLDSRKITNLVLVGLQTEYCMDATCKSAFEHGYQIMIPEETNTTFDNEYLPGEKLYEFYNYKIWNNRFAKVLPVQKAVEMIEQ